MCEIKAIETEYKGYRFRSRLEARWASAFDAMGIEWDYEPEGYEIDGNCAYLPDFVLKNVRFRGDNNGKKNLYIEVKGELNETDRSKVEAFSKYFPIVIVGNFPNDGSADKMRDDDFDYLSFKFVDGDMYRGRFSINEKTDEIWFCGTDHDEYSGDKLMEYGISCGKGARFEHGEKPNRVFKKWDAKEHSGFRTEQTLLALLSTGKLPDGMVKLSDFTNERLKALAEQLLDGKTPAQIITDAENDDQRQAAAETFSLLSEQEKGNAVPIAQDCLRILQIYHLQKEINAMTDLMRTAESPEKRNQALQKVIANSKELAYLKQHGR